MTTSLVSWYGRTYSPTRLNTSPEVERESDVLITRVQFQICVISFQYVEPTGVALLLFMGWPRGLHV